MNLFQRALTGGLFGVLVFGTLFAGSIAFLVFYFLLLILALLEFYKLAGENGLQVHKYSALLASGGLFVILFGYSAGYLHLRWLSLIFLFPPAVMIAELYRKGVSTLNNVAWTLYGIIYITIPISLMNLIVFPGEITGNVYTPQILAGVFMLIMINDTAAFLVGVPLGKRRLFESVSPKKSWEGTIGGGIAVLTAAGFMNRIFPLLDNTKWLATGLIVLVFGVYGDLVESHFKRGLGIKDTGKILPGHGGILDRIDAWVLVIPVVWVYLKLIL